MFKLLFGVAISVMIAVFAFDMNAVSPTIQTVQTAQVHHIAMAMAAVSIEQALYSIESVQRILDIGRSSVYVLIGDGRLDARKIGSKTLITAQSLQKLIAAAPKAAIKIAGNVEAAPSRKRSSTRAVA